jgi:predicted permease
MSYPNYRDLRDRNGAFAGLVAYRIVELGLETGAGTTDRAFGYLATGNYFDVLGVRASLGRFFTPDEDRRPGASPLAVLSDACWRNRFQSDPRIVGRTIRINARPFTVIGIAPPNFHGTELFFAPEVWIPMTMQAQVESFAWLEQRSNGLIWVAGRIKPGVTPQQAEANLNALATILTREYPTVNEGWKIVLTRPGMMGDDLRKATRAFAWGVMILALLVLLAACANLAALLAARSADRFREVAIRASIGAGRLRIVRQFFTEAVLLSLVAGAIGFASAVLLLRLLSHWHIPIGLPAELDVRADSAVVLFALAASTLTGILFGVAPARQAWRMNPHDALKGMFPENRMRRRWPTRDLVLTAQVALCCVLLTGSVVSLRGLARALGIHPGFEPRGASTVSFDPGLAHYTIRDAHALQRRALDAVRRLPGVTAAGYAHSIPLSSDQSSTMVFPPQATDFRVSDGTYATFYDASPGYFSAMGTRLSSGREFTDYDDRTAPPVAIVNETFARKILGTTNVVGGHFFAWPKQRVEIVGVVEDGKYLTLVEDPRPVLFRPISQSFTVTTVMVVRSAAPDSVMAAQVARVIRQLDPTLPLYDVGSLTQITGAAFLPARVASIALVAFGILAAMLAVTGVYGVASYSVSRRTREIGIRVALGAGIGSVLRSLLGRLACFVLAGLAIGLVLGVLASRLLNQVVYHATSRDPSILTAVAAVLSAIALLSALPPARRALTVDPALVLRQE